MNIQSIDFTNGIKSSVLNANFKELETAFEQERLLTAGAGIASGLNLTFDDDFKIHILPGTLIDTDGKDIVFTETTDFEIEKPFLKTKTEKLLVNAEGIFYLTYIPYDTSRKCALTSDTMQQLQIVQITSQIKVTPRNLKDNMVVVDEAYANTYLTITYYYAEVRYDTIYINKKNQIVIAKGTSATSSSIYIPDNIESKALLYILKVDPFATYKDSYYAALSLLTSVKTLRNVYTDSEGNFYIGGLKLNELQFINIEKPTNPKLNQFWYDISTNILYIYSLQNGIKDWVAINNQSSVANYESYLWMPDNNPKDTQTFIFNYDQLNLRYVPDKNALTIIIDQYLLHADQYKEITYKDAINNDYLKPLLIEKGYPMKELTLDINYENTGIGFQLKHPLENNSYVEARIFHAVRLDKTFERFQRSATFIAENYLTLNAQNVVYLSDSYRYHENQLELFIEGRKLVPYVDYLEGNNTQEQGEIINYITFLKTQYSNTKSILNYRITTNIYSYDHVKAIVAPYFDTLKTYTDKIDEKLVTVDEFISNYQSLITRLNALQTTVSSHTVSINANAQTIETQAVSFNKCLEKLEILTNNYKTVQDTLNSLQNTTSALDERLTTLENTVNNLNYQFINYQTTTDQTLSQMQQNILDLQTKVNAVNS